jgi:stage V sporulation protein G
MTSGKGFAVYRIWAVQHELATQGVNVEITEIRLTMKNEEKLKGFVNVTFDNSFVIRGLKIINGSKGFFVSMPSRKRPDGTYQDVAHPINTEMRKHLERTVLEAYEREARLREEKLSHSPGL